MKIALIGYGKVGKAIKQLLNEQFIEVDCYDTIEQQYSTVLTDFSQLDQYDTICSAAPYYANQDIASYCNAAKKHYLDLTEDVETTEFIQSLSWDTMAIPQCGIAPGAVNIIANNIAKNFTHVEDIQMRVGALPQFPNNNMKYNPSWSPEGVINEYCNLCDAIKDGEYVAVQPLQDLETIVIDGMEFEAFNTSGGLGTMYETWKGRTQNMTYKTMRYPGHQQFMKFLLEDFNMADNRETFTKLLKDVPITLQDVVHVYIKVVGIQNKEHKEAVYYRAVHGIGNLTAIELITASGVCAWIWEIAKGFNKPGFVHQTDFKPSSHNPYWDIFLRSID